MRVWPQVFTLVNGRQLRGWRITCGACGETDTVNGFGYGEAEASRQMPNTFARRGWRVAQRAGNDRCPSCIKLEAAARREKRIPMKNEAKAEPPREPTRAELRQVQDALDTAYPVAERGYAGGASDETVAKSLGMPRDWVRRVREQFYGPEADVNLLQVEAQIESLGKDVKATEDRVLEQVATLGRRFDVLLAALAQVRVRLNGAG